MPRATKLICAGTLGALVLVDQIIKYFVIKKVPTGGLFLIDKTWLTVKLDVIINTGIAFGIVLPIALSIAFTIAIALILLAKLTLERQDRIACLSLMAIVAGAASNFLDRFIRDGVVDFFSIAVYNHHWPAFNLADAIIVIGAIALIIKWPKSKTL